MAIISNQTPEIRNRVSFILGRYESMKEVKEKLSNSSDFSWGDAEKLFRFHSDAPTGEDEWRADTVDGWVSATIKTALAAVLSLNPRKQFRPREKSFDFSKTKQLGEILDFIDEKGNWERERYGIYLDALKLGKGFGETIYLKDERKVRDVDTKKIKTVTDFDDIISRRVSPYFFFIDDMASSMDNARDCIKREILDIKEFKRLHGDLSGAALINEASAVEKPEEDAENIIEWARPSDVSMNQVEILHYWNKPEDRYELVVNGVGVAIGRSIPYAHKQLPFFELPFYILSEDEFWCLGVPHVIRKDVNAVVNLQKMRIDREKLNIFKPFLFNALENFNKKLFKLEPLVGIPTRDPNNFREFQFGDVPRSAFLENELLEDSIKRKTGIDERILGISTGGRITATEAAFLREAALKRLGEFLFFIRKTMLTREAKLKYELVKQYYTSPLRTEKITNDDGSVIERQVFRVVTRDAGKGFFDTFEVSKDLFDQDYDIIIDPISIQPESKATEQNRWGTLLAQSTPLIQFGLVDASLPKIYEKYINTFDVSLESIQKGQDINPSVFLAEKESEMMADNKPIPATPKKFIIPEHTAKHKEFLERLKDTGSVSADIEELFKTHIALEVIEFAKNAQAISEKQRVMGQDQLMMPAKVPFPNEIALGGSEVKEMGGRMGEAENNFQRTPQNIQPPIQTNVPPTQ